jgi:hypothetical protein
MNQTISRAINRAINRATCTLQMQMVQSMLHPNRSEYQGGYRRSIEKSCAKAGFLQFLDEKGG